MHKVLVKVWITATPRGADPEHATSTPTMNDNHLLNGGR